MPELWLERTDLIATRSMANEAKKCVTLDNMNEHIKVMEYAVRGPLVIRAREIELELEKVSKLAICITMRLTDLHSSCTGCQEAVQRGSAR